LKTKIYEILRNEIITLCLSPGEPLLEQTLARRFKVSRTPIREVLRRLNHEGLVEIIPQKGAFVAVIGLSDVHEVFQIREALEGLAARIAASRMDKGQLDSIEHKLSERSMEEAAQAGARLHQFILEATENRRLLSMMEILKGQIDRLRAVAGRFPGRTSKSIEEHKEILTALKAKNGELAEKAMRRHIRSTMLSIFEYMQKP
jgi:DNA-binding GntR family transcriptional regulator